MLFRNFYLATSEIFLVLFEVGLDLAEFVQQLVVFQNFQVLHMEIGLGIALKLLSWLSWVDAFEDAESSEVLERYLHLSDSTASCEILGCLSTSPLL